MKINTSPVITSDFIKSLNKMNADIDVIKRSLQLSVSKYPFDDVLKMVRQQTAWRSELLKTVSIQLTPMVNLHSQILSEIRASIRLASIDFSPIYETLRTIHNDFQVDIESKQDSEFEMLTVELESKVDRVVEENLSETEKINKIYSYMVGFVVKHYDEKQVVYMILSQILSIITAAIMSQLTLQQPTQVINYNYTIKVDSIESKRSINKTLKEVEIPKDYKAVHRYINKDNLPVYDAKSLKANKLVQLNFGKIVRVINKQRNWTLVEYAGTEGLEYGWVLTRYTAQIK